MRLVAIVYFISVKFYFYGFFSKLPLAQVVVVFGGCQNKPRQHAHWLSCFGWELYCQYPSITKWFKEIHVAGNCGKFITLTMPFRRQIIPPGAPLIRNILFDSIRARSLSLLSLCVVMHVVRSEIRANNPRKKVRETLLEIQTGNLASDEFGNNKVGCRCAWLFIFCIHFACSNH